MRLRHTLVFAALLASPFRAGAVAPADSVVESAAPVVALEFVSDAPADATPRAFRISAPRPNPFRSATRFDIALDESDEITVAVHDALGRRVALLQDGGMRAGSYTLTLNANGLPPGLYLIRATDGRGVTATRSVALVR